MRQSGRIVRQVLDHVRSMVAPGVTTMDLERAAEKKIAEFGAKPAFKGYYDYPCVLCTSVNEEIVHGIPSEKRALKAGDIVSIDCGVVLDGYYGDAAITVPVSDSDRNRGVALPRHRPGRHWQLGGRCGSGGAGTRGSEWLQRGPGIRGTWHWNAPARRAAGAELRSARAWREIAGRHGARNRAHGELRQAGNASARRQVDGSDGGRQLQRAL